MTSRALLLLAFGTLTSLAACSDDDASSGGSGGSGASGGSGGAGGSGAAGGSGGTGGAGGALLESCAVAHEATTSDGKAVVDCEELFDEAPFVRPPLDTASVAFAATDGSQLFLRDAEPRVITSEEREVLGLGVESDDEAKRSGYAIYRVELDDAGAVIASAPAIVIEDAALLGALAGKTVEGLVSARSDDPNAADDFESPPTLRVRLRFADVATASDAADPLLDVITESQLALTLENATAGVLSADGGCLAPLTDAGAASPFDGAEAPPLRALRVPSMHGPGDNELVVDGAALLNHMTPGWIVMPHHLLLGEVPALDAADFMPHGNPLSMPDFNLVIVEGGGGPCP